MDLLQLPFVVTLVLWVVLYHIVLSYHYIGDIVNLLDFIVSGLSITISYSLYILGLYLICIGGYVSCWSIS